MKTWMNFYDYYLRDLPGCSSFAAESELRKAAQEYCRKTQIWRVTFDPMFMVTGVDTYEFDITTSQEVHKLLSAKLDGQPITPMLPDSDGEFAVRGIKPLSGREFQMFPTPSDGQILVIKAVMYPSNTATGVEDFIYADHAEAIAQGAKARLKAISDKPYSDPAGAAVAEAKFNDAIGNAAFRSAQGFSRAPLRTRASFI